jgi:hypothetical protein
MNILKHIAPTKFWNKVYDILVEECGAHEDERKDFVFHQQEKDFPMEWRFCGMLGFGGKFWRTSIQMYVTCYTEHMTPERELAIGKANERLEKLN